MASAPCLQAAPHLDARYDPSFDSNAALRASVSGGKDTAQLRGTSSEAVRTSVFARWNEQGLFFVFNCVDRRITSPGDRDGLDHFLLGDTVEVFLAKRGQSSYTEIHATPAGRKTLYFFETYRSSMPAPAGAEGVDVTAAPSEDGWCAVVEVPWSVLGGRGGDATWEVFFGRYDYDGSGGRPVLSSYPSQRGGKPDFHRRADYALLQLLP